MNKFSDYDIKSDYDIWCLQQLATENQLSYIMSLLEQYYINNTKQDNYDFSKIMYIMKMKKYKTVKYQNT